MIYTAYCSIGTVVVHNDNFPADLSVGRVSQLIRGLLLMSSRLVESLGQQIDNDGQVSRFVISWQQHRIALACSHVRPACSGTRPFLATSLKLKVLGPCCFVVSIGLSYVCRSWLLEKWSFGLVRVRISDSLLSSGHCPLPRGTFSTTRYCCAAPFRFVGLLRVPEPTQTKVAVYHVTSSRLAFEVSRS